MREEDRNCFLKKYGLEEYPDIAISHTKVNAYLFKEKNEEIELRPLEIDKYGIIDESFKEVSEELFERSMELGEKVE